MACCCQSNEDTIFGKDRQEFSDVSDNTRRDLLERRLSDFKYRRVIGNGSFGKVYMVMERHTGKYLAMKEIRFRKLTRLRVDSLLENEEVFMSKVKSMWLVEVFRCFETPSRRCILMELLPGPTLLHVLKSKGNIPEQQLRIYAAEMLMAIIVVHRNGFMHRDIKLTNFLFSFSGHIKLCDFGFCVQFLATDICKKVFPPDEDLRADLPSSVLATRREVIQQYQHMSWVPHGTTYYCSPEVIRLTMELPAYEKDEPYTYLCDYWSYGVCLYYLVFKRLPFFEDDKSLVANMIIHWRKTLMFPGEKHLPSSAMKLIRALLCDASDRLGANGFQELTRHRYFRHIDWEHLGSSVPPPLLYEWSTSAMDTTKRSSCLPSLCCWMPDNQRRKKDTKADAEKTPSYTSAKNLSEPSLSFDGHSLKELMTGPISDNGAIAVTEDQSASELPGKPDQMASTARVEDKDFDPTKRDKPSDVVARESSVDPNIFEVIKIKYLFNWSNNTRWKKANEPVTERSASDEESYKAKSVVSENNCASLSASFRRRNEHKSKKKLKSVEMLGSISDVVQRSGCLDTSGSKSLHTLDIPGQVGDVISCIDDKKVSEVSEPTHELAKIISTVSTERVDGVGQFQELVFHHESPIALKSFQLKLANLNKDDSNHSDISYHSAQESI